MAVRRGLVATVIAAQFCVPLVALLASAPPTRLGFQMYSGLGGLDITVEDERGEELEYDPADILAVSPRIEIDWTRRLPEALCEATGAARVTVGRPEATRTVTC